MKYNQYILMHKNTPCIAMTLDGETGSILKCDILDEKHAPLGHSNSKAFVNWWERRAVPKHQIDIDKLTNGELNTKYMMDNLGLSLIDGYWIKPANSSYTWEQVNLYSNSFTEKGFS